MLPFHFAIMRSAEDESVQLEQIASLPFRVPGVRVRRSYDVEAPAHGAWLVDMWLRQWGYTFNVRCLSPQAADLFSLTTEAARESAADLGGYFIDQLVNRGVLKPHVTRDYLTPYQRIAAGYAAARHSLYLHWAPGAGKTLGGILWLAAYPGPRIIVTRAAARGTWEREIKASTSWVPWVHRPESTLRKRDVPFSDYVDWCQKQQQPPVLVFSYESLPQALKLLDFPSYRLVFDEAHRASEHKRWKAQPGDDGTMAFSLRTTPEGRMPVSVACYILAKHAHGGRMAMSATPIPDRASDLWAQLDIIEPGAWGNFQKFANRYCGPSKTQYGTKYDGATNTDELQQRLAWRYFRVGYQESHGALPPKRREVVRLEPKDQVRELERFDKIKATDRQQQMEIKIAIAASRKRRYVVERAAEAVEAGQKVFVACGRIKEAATIADQLRKRVQQDVIEIHGGVTIDVDDEVERYMTASSAILVGTVDRAGESLNLQDTDLMLITHLPWTWGKLWQLENRVSRLGMERPVLISFIVAIGSIDEGIASIFLDKLPAIGQLSQDEEVGTVEDMLIGVDDEDMLDRILSKITGEDE
jgi:hypothetical protein